MLSKHNGIDAHVVYGVVAGDHPELEGVAAGDDGRVDGGGAVGVEVGAAVSEKCARQKIDSERVCACCVFGCVFVCVFVFVCVCVCVNVRVFVCMFMPVRLLKAF